jgi:hypothetical protein
MMVTNFFELPAQAEDFRACVHSIEADGGGDDPEDGLEALAYAMKSDWDMSAQKHRHVIVVWSDDAAHELGHGKMMANYPKNMAKDFDELTEWWGSRSVPGIMNEKAKRLLLFTPNVPYWSNIRNNWNNVVMYESEAGSGLEDCDYSQILNAISNSI